ncbi:MAG: 3-phosphoglycerate dehydrogenase [Flavobacteriia bacterium]|nr:3-phosphoglycerate dehydrogenase [Flavobacteriia bacterium]
MKILANDGISQTGIDFLQENGFEVITVNVAQAQLVDYINDNEVSALLVRSATTARKELIDQCPGLKLIGRGGVGMDNIDVEYAKSKGLHVINTPAASSASVAELVFAHLYGGVRFLYDSNRSMPLEGETNFKGLKKAYAKGVLKKAYAKGVELRGKTLGIIGFGRIGQEVAKIGFGIGMQVIATDKFIEKAAVEVALYSGKSIVEEIKTQSMESVLSQSDFISLHVPAQKNYVIDEQAFSQMKKGAALINAARGGVVDEVALVKALDSGQLSFAALDTFENEPKPEIKLLMHDKISLTPHIGAATLEAQDRIGEELAQQITTLLK